MDVFNQSFHTPIHIDKFFSGFITHTRQSRYIVYSITFHTQKINHLLGVFDFKLGLYFIHSPSLITTSEHGAVHKNISAHQLSKIFIWGHHKSLVAIFFRFFGQGSNDIICLITFFDNGRNIHGLQ